MKDFMLVFRGPNYEDLNFTPEQSQAAMQKWMEWIGKLSAQERYVGGAPLTAEGKMIKGKKPLITDGPFAEGKESVGGYLIIKADTLKEASDLALGFPDFEIGGSVEVREIVPMSM
jgi:hypothetical protein